MADEEAALAQELDTPEPPSNEAPEGTPSEQQSAIDWESDDNPYKGRHSEAQAWGTKTSQELARERQEKAEYERFVQSLNDEEMQRHLMRNWGWNPEDADDDEDHDPVAELAQKVNELEGTLTAKEQAEAEAEYEATREEYIGVVIGEHGKNLTDADKNLVYNLAQSGQYDEDNAPDVKGIIDFVEAAWAERQKNWRESKKSEVPGLGQAGDESIDLTDDDARTRLLANMLEAGQAD